MSVQIQVLHSSDFDGATWYAIRVRENHQEWLVQRRFSQFIDLDSQLASSSTISRVPLPQKGTFGLRKALSLRGFMENRRLGLAVYMAHLAGQLQSLSQVPILQHFLLPPAPPAPLGAVVVGIPVTASVPLAPLAVEGPSLVEMLPSAPARGELLRSDAEVRAVTAAMPSVLGRWMMDRNIRRLEAMVDAMDSSAVKTGCGHCNGLGFRHNSCMEHDMPEHERCFFCQDCQVCRGMGCRRSLRSASQSSCKCGGRGFLHKSSIRHHEPWQSRCFFCTTCPQCRGQGLAAAAAMAA